MNPPERLGKTSDSPPTMSGFDPARAASTREDSSTVRSLPVFVVERVLPSEKLLRIRAVPESRFTSTQRSADAMRFLLFFV